MQSVEINELASALVKAQGEFSAIPKSSNNPFFNSKYAALPEVVAAATPILAKNGLAVSQFITYTEDGSDALITHLIHESGQYISYSMKLHLVPDKNGFITPQAQGSATTYARRYSYMSVLGLVADEDDDGNAASQSQPNTGTQSKSSEKPASDFKSKVAKAAGQSTGANMATEKMCKMIWAICHKSLNYDDLKQYEVIESIVERPVESLESLTFDEAKAVIEHLQSLQ